MAANCLGLNVLITTKVCTVVQRYDFWCISRIAADILLPSKWDVAFFSISQLMYTCDFNLSRLEFHGSKFLCMLQHVLSGPTCEKYWWSSQGLPRLQTALHIIRELRECTHMCIAKQLHNIKMVNFTRPYTPHPHPSPRPLPHKQKSPIDLFCAPVVQFV